MFSKCWVREIPDIKPTALTDVQSRNPSVASVHIDGGPQPLRPNPKPAAPKSLTLDFPNPNTHN